VVECRDEAGENFDAAALDDEVVETAAKLHAPHFDNAHAPPLGAVWPGNLLHPQHAVADAVKIEVVRFRGEVVEQQDGRILQQEEVLEGKDLPPVAQRALRQEADLGQAVEDDPRRLEPLDFGEHELHRLSEFEIRRMDEALLLFRIEAELGRNKLTDRDPFEGPAMCRGNRLELAFALGKRDVEPALSS
jgi:hypothetical protein